MSPDDIQAVVLERRELGVADVRFAFFLNVDAAGRRNSLRPAKIQHPADRVEHVDAHVAHDAVAIFRERPPPAFMWQAVVRTQRRGAGPHFVIEKIGHRFGRGVAVGAHVEITA